MKAFITGASSAIALYLLKELSRQGYHITACCKNIASLKTLDSEFPSIAIFQADFTNKEDQEKVLKLCEKEVFDLIIQNAGSGLYGPAYIHSKEEIENMYILNALFPSLLTITASNALKNSHKNGTILHVSSAVDALYYPHFAIYSASKAALTQFCRAFHAEMKPFGVDILVCSPGQIQTAFQFKASKGLYDGKEDSHAMSAEYVAKRILKQIISKKPYDIFPFTIKILREVLRFLPSSFRNSLLQKSLKKRWKE